MTGPAPAVVIGQDDAVMIPPAEPDASDPGPARLRFGYTMRAAEQLARAAMNPTRTGLADGLDHSDAYEVCWGTIVETIYAASPNEPPSPAWLVRAARYALGSLVSAERRHRGKVYHKGQNRANFVVFWDWCAQRRAPSPETVTVERAALAQIWAVLRPIEQETLAALATFNDHAAAASLGLTVKAFCNRLSKARRRVLALWHEGETPSRLWRPDQRDYSANRRIGLSHRRESCCCAACTAYRAKAERAPGREREQSALVWVSRRPHRTRE